MSVNKSNIKSGVIAIVMLMYLFVGYYPILPLPDFNNGANLSEDEGLQFLSAGIAYTNLIPGWLVNAIDGPSLDISLDVQPSTVNQVHRARIMTISANHTIIVGQEGVDLTVRLRGPGEIFNGNRKFVVRKVFDNLDRHILLISLRPRKVTIFVDQEERLSTEFFDFVHDTRARDHHLALGNKITYDHPWLGYIREAIINVNGRKVDYLKPGVLELSGTYYLQYLFHRINPVLFYQQASPIEQFQDWAVNFFGFIPLGLLCIVFYPGWKIRRITIICLGVSLVIETMQIFLPWRTPGVGDLILNTLGGAVGAWVGVNYWKDSRNRSISG